MLGYSNINTGFPSNMQPALAYAASTGNSASAAWAVFESRSVKPTDWALGPQFAIKPR
jgi:hypothetical protein